jgi:hypothetical protein
MRHRGLYLGDIPPVPEQVDRRLAEYVMAQNEAPANLDRRPNPAGRLVTLVLTRLDRSHRPGWW